jgi:predicted nucleic acid-binding protein
MILVDTSVWIDFFRGARRAQDLATLLTENRVAAHDWVIGELLLGHLGKQRKMIIDDLRRLPRLSSATLSEIEHFVEEESLFGKGLSLVDTQLLYSSIVEKAKLWTHDKGLEQVATAYAVNF